MIAPMSSATNLSATRRTLSALRRSERLTEQHAGLARLALSTARALDVAQAGGAKAYEIAQASRAHLLALEALASIPEPMSPDAFDRFVAELSLPSGDDSRDRG
jgi:hypothetical protein